MQLIGLGIVLDSKGCMLDILKENGVHVRYIENLGVYVRYLPLKLIACDFAKEFKP
jgi:hypothetical protein